MSETHNVIIIGSGPAGYTAGLYAARAMLNPLMFAGYMSGGQLMLTSDIENFPGYPKGIGGPEMMMELREQAERFGLQVQDKNVESVDVSERPYKVVVEGETFLTHSIIVCTGAESIWLNMPGEEEQKGRGISTCATCDGAFFKDEEVMNVNAFRLSKLKESLQFLVINIILWFARDYLFQDLSFVEVNQFF